MLKTTDFHLWQILIATTSMVNPGAHADLCVWDTSGVHDAGVADPVAGLLWASPGRRPRDVYVGGRAVVKDGKLVNADERQIVAALAERPAD